MKMKTSVTLSEDIVKTLNRTARKGESRSEHIERLLREALNRRGREAGDARDRAILDRHARTLNAQAEDVLAYQTEP